MRHTLLTPLVALALTGCSFLGQETTCTEADADSQVAAVWRPADFGTRDAAWIRLCVDGMCEERTSGSPDDPFATLAIPLTDDIGDATVPVQLTVTSVARSPTRTSRQSALPSGTARLRRLSPRR